jgi:hypothetical protein
MGSEIGCQWTLGQAYLYSKEAGNDLPNFAEVIWDDDIETILADCRRLGVKEFTISSTFSSLIETIARFEELGCTLDGIVRVKERYTHFGSDERPDPGIQDDGKGGINHVERRNHRNPGCQGQGKIHQVPLLGKALRRAQRDLRHQRRQDQQAHDQDQRNRRSNYDRGWDIEPTCKEAELALCILLNNYN